MCRNGAADRVLRGGSWNNDARNVRAAYRNQNDPANRDNNVGFRCARAPEWTGVSAREQAHVHGVAADPAFTETGGGRRVGRVAGGPPRRLAGLALLPNTRDADSIDLRYRSV